MSCLFRMRHPDSSIDQVHSELWEWVRAFTNGCESTIEMPVEAVNVLLWFMILSLSTLSHSWNPPSPSGAPVACQATCHPLCCELWHLPLSLMHSKSTRSNMYMMDMCISIYVYIIIYIYMVLPKGFFFGGHAACGGTTENMYTYLYIYAHTYPWQKSFWIYIYLFFVFSRFFVLFSLLHMFYFFAFSSCFFDLHSFQIRLYSVKRKHGSCVAVPL